VMKYIAGGSLQQRIDREGPLEVCEVLRIGMQTAKGLAAAHAQGLIHRDVKPSNILLDEGVDRALLTDFGLARATDDASLTRSGFHPGTPHYMSPEQVRGEAIDARSDLFGLGCVLYALCTGHPPFRSETSYAVLRRITDDIPRSIRETNPNIPAWLEQIVMKLLAKSPDDRYVSATEVHTLLEKCLAHVQQPTAVELPVELQSKSASRKWLVSLAIVPVCIVIASGVWWLNQLPTNIDANAAVPQAESVSVSAEPVLQWDSGTNELDSLRRAFEPVETKTKKLWDIEPTTQ
jgi:serine/threonine protein kinase